MKPPSVAGVPVAEAGELFVGTAKGKRQKKNIGADYSSVFFYFFIVGCDGGRSNVFGW